MNNNRGVSLVELVVYVGLSAVVLGVSLSVMKISSNLVKSSNTFVGINEIRSTILDTLKNDTAWKNTLNYAGNGTVFKCVVGNGTGLGGKLSCKNKGGAFTLMTTQNTVFTQAAKAGNNTDGITSSGTYCNTFSTTTGNDNCPYRYVLTWIPRCTTTDCFNPTIEVRATLEAKFRNQKNELNLSTYSITLIKQNSTAALADTCNSMGGTFQANGTCVMPYAGFQCAKGTYIRGFTTSGQPICQSMSAFRCNKGEVLLGVDANGIAHCGPGCAATTSSAGSIW